MTKDEALMLALDFIEETDCGTADLEAQIKEALAQPEQEPVTWDKPSASFNEWWDSDRRRNNANPFQTDSFAYWAFEGWQAALAQRQ